jgi:hypothetical protein
VGSDCLRPSNAFYKNYSVTGERHLGVNGIPEKNIFISLKLMLNQSQHHLLEIKQNHLCFPFMQNYFLPKFLQQTEHKSPRAKSTQHGNGGAPEVPQRSYTPQINLSK